CYGFPEDFTISVSNDGNTWQTVVTKTGYPIPSYGPQTFTFTSKTARYVKFEATKLRQKPTDGNTYRVQLAEFELYNTAVPDGIITIEGKEYYYRGGEKVIDEIVI